MHTRYLLNQLVELDKQLSLLEIKKIEMQHNYTTAHPMFVALTHQMNQLELQQNQIKLEFKKIPASDQIAANLMRDVKVKESLYLILLNKIQELQVVKAGTVSSVRILSFAKMPDAPLPSKKIIICLGGLIIGFLLSFCFIFIVNIFFKYIIT
jgi:tyrosine-protein kinase Etk/Wzc